MSGAPLSIAGYEMQATGTLEQVTRQLAWRGIVAKMRLMVGDPKEARAHLSHEIAERQRRPACGGWLRARALARGLIRRRDRINR
jgi:hypothetical protein